MIFTKIKEWTEKNHAALITTFNELHQISELSWREVETTAYLCKQLDAMGMAYQTFSDQTGIVVCWEATGSSGSTIALRSDMDGLPYNTDKGLEVLHTCGHDAHMTMVLHTLRCLMECGFAPQGRLKVLFQPAEEIGEGARSFIEKGVTHDIDYMLGVHLRPIDELPFGLASPAIYHGCAIQMVGKIKGIQAHAARSQSGVNVVDSLGEVIHAMNKIKANLAASQSVNITSISAGDSINTIPGQATFAMDLRSRTRAGMDELVERVQAAAYLAGEANGAKLDLHVKSYMKAAVPNVMMENIVGNAISEVMGEENCRPAITTPGGEDFHEYAYENGNKSIKTTMLGLGADLKPGLHHPEMSFDLRTLSLGVNILSTAIVMLSKATQDEQFIETTKHYIN